jgi:E3 ubiquitin-protein ligase UHRF1
MMQLIESLQRKAVEEGDTKVASDGSNDAEEYADDSEEDGDAMERDEDDSSLDDEEEDSAGDKKTECPNDDSDVNIDGSVKIVVDNKHEGDDAEKGKGDKIKVSVPEVVAVLVEENAAKQTKGAGNKESQPQPQKRKGNAVVGTNTAKRMKNSATVKELNVCSTPVKQTRKVGEADGSPAAVSSGRRVTRSSANASEADDSPARRTRSRA